MLLACAQLVLGFLIISWSADRFVIGASALAYRMRIPPLIIGLTIVALGTSAPEMLVVITAAIHGSPGIGIGNAIGSNIANIGLVLGITALIAPLMVHSSTLKREFPILFIIMAITWYVLSDGVLDIQESIVLFIVLGLLMALMIYFGLKPKPGDVLEQEFAAEDPHLSYLNAFMWLIIGMIGLPISSEILVTGAVSIAHSLNISDWIIGLTVVAIGTSMPEIATSISSVLKNEHDIAIGNILGSNMFNLVAVLPWAGVMHPSEVDMSILNRDFPVMLAFSAALFLIGFGFKQNGHISRFKGALLLCAFILYVAVLIFFH